MDQFYWICMEQIVILIVYNFLFFWKIWINPFTISRSELLSTFYPSWLYIGRQLRQSKSWKHEPCYWLNFHAHPVLSSYYPPHVITSWIASFLNLDDAFVLLTHTILAHFIWMSLGWYFLLNISYTSIPLLIFGALTLTYSGYNIKQQPCIVYTISWFPWLLYGIASNNVFIASLSCGMTFLSGYYPLGIQTLGISGLASLLWGWNLLWVPVGILIGLPQLIPFLRYLPKTIRTVQSELVSVGFWEKAFFPGTPVFFLIWFSTSRVWPLLVIGSILALGVGQKCLPRISHRWLFTVQFCLGWMAVSGLANLSIPAGATYALVILQGFSLYIVNSSLIPTLPYAELWNRPSRAFKTRITAFLEAHLDPNNRVSGLPYPIFTGLINGFKTLGYSGGMQLKLMAKWRNDTNPNGSGEHDYFKRNSDGEAVDRARVQFAFTSSKLDWQSTSVPRLWCNPRLQSIPS